MAGFALRQAARETRASWRRVGLYMASITLGVAALVAINSFRANVQASVGGSARELLGADLRLRSSMPFPPAVQAVVDSMARSGYRLDYETDLVSMGLAARTGLTRLVRVVGMGDALPFYGRYVTQPAGVWQRFRQENGALVDPGVLLQLGMRVGDTILLGTRRFPVIGTVLSGGSDVSLQSAFAPRVFVSLPALRSTGLLAFGSLARYEVYMAVPSAGERERFVNGHRDAFRAVDVDVHTAEHIAEEITESLSMLSKFLGLVGLAALLLGGVGVGSAIHVFIKGRLETVAVLRCLGATQREVFAAYLLQSAFLGLLGSAAGAALGIAVQAVLPRLMPIALEVPFALDPPAILAGLATGVWVAAMFALLPLLGVRDVAPLQALRRDYEPPRRRLDWRRALAYVLLAGSILALSVWQAPALRIGLAFALALALVALILWLIALALVHGTRRFFPEHARYVVRQGVSNLFRPHNQTVAVTLALGFGIFLVATLYLVHGAILDRIAVSGIASRANLLLFDMQPTQVPGVRAVLARRHLALMDVTPIVPARIAAVKGRPVADILATLPRHRPGEVRDEPPDRPPQQGQRGGAQAPRQPHAWALRREYRNTYRDTMTSSETLVAGRWWPRGSRAGAVPQVSLEEGVAGELGVALGDTITWDLRGVMVPSVVTSLRRVQWARLSANFFVVFQPGAIDAAPQTDVALVNVPGGDNALARVQAELVRAYPGITMLDLSLIQRTLDAVLGKVTLAVRFLALFSLGAGLIVLIGALATSRFQRVRESALLKTLGATRRQVLQVLFTEYAALGLLAGLTGTLLAVAGGWALVHFFFKFAFRPPVLSLLASWAIVAALTVAVGLLNSRDVLRRPPLAVLREAE